MKTKLLNKITTFILCVILTMNVAVPVFAADSFTVQEDVHISGTAQNNAAPQVTGSATSDSSSSQNADPALTQQTLTDHGVTVEGLLPDAAQLVAEPLNDTSHLEQLISSSLDDGAVFHALAAFDIHIKSDDVDDYQPDEYGTVLSMDLSNINLGSADTEFLKVYHITDNNEVELVGTHLDNLSVTGFSPYLIGTDEYDDTTTSYLITGPAFNTAIKRLVNPSAISFTSISSSPIDTTITNIRWVDDAFTSDTELQADGAPVYARLNGTVVELYTAASTVFFNSNSRSMFSNFASMGSISMLSSKINTHYTTTADYMFSLVYQNPYEKTRQTLGYELRNSVLDLSRFDFSNFAFSNSVYGDGYRHCSAFLTNDVEEYWYDAAYNILKFSPAAIASIPDGCAFTTGLDAGFTDHVATESNSAYYITNTINGNHYLFYDSDQLITVYFYNADGSQLLTQQNYYQDARVAELQPPIIDNIDGWAYEPGGQMFWTPNSCFNFNAIKGATVNGPDPETGLFNIYGYNLNNDTDIISNLTMNVYAKSYQYYTVEFDSDGGTEYASQNIREGLKATHPGYPSKTDMRFIGWFLHDTDTEPFDFNTTITEPITLHARYKEYTYNLEYLFTDIDTGETYLDANVQTPVNGSDSEFLQQLKNVGAPNNEYAAANFTMPSYAPYILQGIVRMWPLNYVPGESNICDSQDYRIYYHNGIQWQYFTPADTPPEFIAASVGLYVVNNAFDMTNDSMDIYVGSRLHQSAATNYIYLSPSDISGFSWNYKDTMFDYTEAYLDEIILGVSSDAIAFDNSYFSAGEGWFSEEILPDIIERDQFGFALGQYDAQTVSSYCDARITISSALSIDTIMLLYKRANTQHAVTFNMGYDETNPVQNVYDSDYATAIEPTRDGYTFEGWYTNENYTGNKFNFKRTRITAPITLYAKWRQWYINISYRFYNEQTQELYDPYYVSHPEQVPDTWAPSEFLLLLNESNAGNLPGQYHNGDALVAPSLWDYKIGEYSGFVQAKDFFWVDVTHNHKLNNYMIYWYDGAQWINTDARTALKDYPYYLIPGTSLYIVNNDCDTSTDITLDVYTENDNAITTIASNYFSILVDDLFLRDANTSRGSEYYLRVDNVSATTIDVYSSADKLAPGVGVFNESVLPDYGDLLNHEQVNLRATETSHSWSNTVYLIYHYTSYDYDAAMTADSQNDVNIEIDPTMTSDNILDMLGLTRGQQDYNKDVHFDAHIQSQDIDEDTVINNTNYQALATANTVKASKYAYFFNVFASYDRYENAAYTSTTAIEELSEPVKFSIPLDAILAEASENGQALTLDDIESIRLASVHNGEYYEIDATLSDDGQDLIFELNKFSPFAVMINSTVAAPADNSGSGSGSNSGSSSSGNNNSSGNTGTNTSSGNSSNNSSGNTSTSSSKSSSVNTGNTNATASAKTATQAVNTTTSRPSVQTGDMHPITALSVILICSLISLIAGTLIVKKRKKGE